MEYTDINDNYEPVEPNYYDYKALNNLNKNINHLLKNTEILSIKIFAFEVNNEAINHFLKLFLYKNEYTETLNFLSLDFNEDFPSFIDEICSSYFKNYTASISLTLVIIISKTSIH